MAESQLENWQPEAVKLIHELDARKVLVATIAGAGPNQAAQDSVKNGTTCPGWKTE